LNGIFYILHDYLIADFDTNNSKIRFLFQKTDINAIEAVIKGIQKFKTKGKKETPNIVARYHTCRYSYKMTFT